MLVKEINDLLIYKMSLQYSSEVVELVQFIPYHWNIPEVKQVIRSSSSIHSNIMEGFSQRFYLKKFLYYLNIALGSSDETRGHIEKLTLDRKIDQIESENFLKKYKNLSVRILNFINYLRKNSQN